ncbi:MAG TPA: YeeE/YedE family protein [Alphaproteobacteria bacterium]|nr:YeeE/YedE family protein [Alphaproteobacteria bacterium]
MVNFTPVSALIGGAMIGVAAAILLLMNGRIAGISGIVGGSLELPRGDFAWRLAFIIGLIVGPLLVQFARGAPISVQIEAGLPLLIAAGFIVGLSTRLGSGCTSGHGVCGLGRLSGRSIVATATFLMTAGLTVFAARHLIGG